MLPRIVTGVVLLTGLLFGQNAGLSGRYWVRHLQSGADVRSFAGTLAFDGNGGFTYNGTQTIGGFTPTSMNGGGTYALQASGALTLTNPQQNGVMMIGRLGVGALIASTTEGNVSDLLIAVPVSTTAPSLSGNYWVSSLDFPGGAVA